MRQATFACAGWPTFRHRIPRRENVALWRGATSAKGPRPRQTCTLTARREELELSAPGSRAGPNSRPLHCRDQHKREAKPSEDVASRTRWALCFAGPGPLYASGSFDRIGMLILAPATGKPSRVSGRMRK